MSLNDDCLLEIFGYLPLNEQLSVARTCIRFCNIVGMILRGKISIIKVNDDLSKQLKCADIIILLKMVSSEITQLDILIEAIFKPELEFYLTLNLDNLVVLNFKGYDLNDNHVVLFGNKCKNLQSFSVSYSKISGKSVEEMKKLKKAFFDGCAIEPWHIERILSDLPLEELKIISNHTYHLPRTIMSVPVTTLKQLTIDDAQFFGITLLEKFPLTNLTNRHLHENFRFYFSNTMPPNEFTKVKRNLRKITFFGSSNFNCMQYLISYLQRTPQDLVWIHFLNTLLLLIDCCSQLQCIEIGYYFTQLYIFNVSLIVEKLRNQNRLFRLVIFECHSCEYKHEVLNSSSYTQQNNLTIEFKYDSNWDTDHYVRYEMCDPNV